MRIIKERNNNYFGTLFDFLYSTAVKYFLLVSFNRTNTREVYRNLQHQLMEIISWKFGEHKEMEVEVEEKEVIHVDINL